MNTWSGPVRWLVAAQFRSAGLPVTALQPTRVVNAICPLGDDLRARLPRVQTWARIPGQGMALAA